MTGGGQRWVVAVLGSAMVAGCGQRAQSQAANPQPELTAPGRPAQSWIESAVKYEVEIIQSNDLPMRYRQRKVNTHGDTTRIVIESREGNVARLVERDGRPLSADEDAAERQRLNDILNDPEAYLRRQKRENSGRDYALQLVKLMPQAMIYTYTPGQPQAPGATARQLVIDFTPNPAFHPPTMLSEALTGLEGRVWLDAQTGRMMRIQAHVLHTVYIGWGIIGKIYPGGTVEFEQTCIDGKRWMYSHLDENLTLREMMVRTVVDSTKINSWEFEFLPAPMSVQDAVRALLAMPVKVR